MSAKSAVETTGSWMISSGEARSQVSDHLSITVTTVVVVPAQATLTSWTELTSWTTLVAGSPQPPNDGAVIVVWSSVVFVSTIGVGPASQTSSPHSATTLTPVTEAVVISVGTLVPLLVGAFCVWFLVRRRRRMAQVVEKEQPEHAESAEAETERVPISELSDVKEPREVEDMGIREMPVAPIELEGDGPVKMPASREELVEGENWLHDTLGAVLSTK